MYPGPGESRKANPTTLATDGMTIGRMGTSLRKPIRRGNWVVAKASTVPHTIAITSEKNASAAVVCSVSTMSARPYCDL